MKNYNIMHQLLPEICRQVIQSKNKLVGFLKWIFNLWYGQGWFWSLKQWWGQQNMGACTNKFALCYYPICMTLHTWHWRGMEHMVLNVILWKKMALEYIEGVLHERKTWFAWGKVKLGNLPHCQIRTDLFYGLIYTAGDICLFLMFPQVQILPLARRSPSSWNVWRQSTLSCILRVNSTRWCKGEVRTICGSDIKGVV